MNKALANVIQWAAGSLKSSHRLAKAANVSLSKLTASLLSKILLLWSTKKPPMRNSQAALLSTQHQPGRHTQGTLYPLTKCHHTILNNVAFHLNEAARCLCLLLQPWYQNELASWTNSSKLSPGCRWLTELHKTTRFKVDKAAPSTLIVTPVLKSHSPVSQDAMRAALNTSVA